MGNALEDALLPQISRLDCPSSAVLVVLTLALSKQKNMSISLSRSAAKAQILVIPYFSISSLKDTPLNANQISELKVRNKNGENVVSFFQKGQHITCYKLEKGNDAATLEKTRVAGNKAMQFCNERKAKEVAVHSTLANATMDCAFVEGMALGNYRFDRHFTGDTDSSAKNIKVVNSALDASTLKTLNSMVEAVFLSRDLVNEPLNYMNATDLANAAKKAGKKAGFKVEVLNKQKISALKMGGLLAVNVGSIDPPTFSIMNWSPPKAVNKKPLVLVGKGVVYDTGGLSLKPTAGSMDHMKCDMAGAAAVIGAMYAIAALKLPIKVIGLVPATDNRPSGNAYAPGDVITMHSGKTVEVLNTDAEGRLILADAISYADKYDPELIIDLATLTGAAASAIGPKGSVVMGTADAKVFKALEKNGEQVHERVAQFPFWEEYDEDLKSPIADMKNLGGSTGGAITAGKFLNRFTERPHVHIDIAGTAFLNAAESYRPKGGTGVGVRLLLATIKDLYNVG